MTSFATTTSSRPCSTATSPRPWPTPSRPKRARAASPRREPRSGSARPRSSGCLPGGDARRRAYPDPITQDADPFDLELHVVPRLQPPLIAVLEDASPAHRPRADHVAGDQTGRVACRRLEQLLPGEVHPAGTRIGAELAVDPRDRAHVEVAR